MNPIRGTLRCVSSKHTPHRAIQGTFPKVPTLGEAFWIFADDGRFLRTSRVKSWKKTWGRFIEPGRPMVEHQPPVWEFKTENSSYVLTQIG